MHRLFIALNIPHEIREHIRQARNTILFNSFAYRWEKEEKVHLTLKFLGDISEEKLSEVQKIFEQVTFDKPFHCELTRFGFFFRQGKPKILYAEMKTPPELSAYAARLNDAFTGLGVKKEKRAFKPHLTILRIKKPVEPSFVKAFEGYTFQEADFTAKRVTLFESKLLQKGSVYTELETITLED